jgi:hypothetical protein
MLEGNPAPKQWGGKPIPIYRVWSYKIEIVDRRIVNLVIYQDKIPFWTFNHSMVGSDGSSIVRKIMVALFARASNIAEDLPPTQVGDFLSAIHDITYDLTGLLTSRVYNEN